jgi:hypothetical protein
MEETSKSWIVTSTLEFKIRRDQHNRILRCVSEHEALLEKKLETGIKLNVQCEFSCLHFLLGSGVSVKKKKITGIYFPMIFLLAENISYVFYVCLHLCMRKRELYWQGGRIGNCAMARQLTIN